MWAAVWLADLWWRRNEERGEKGGELEGEKERQRKGNYRSERLIHLHEREEREERERVMYTYQGWWRENTMWVR